MPTEYIHEVSQLHLSISHEGILDGVPIEDVFQSRITVYEHLLV